MHITVADIGKIDENHKPVNDIVSGLEEYSLINFTGRTEPESGNWDDEFFVYLHLNFNEPVIGAGGVYYLLETKSLHL